MELPHAPFLTISSDCRCTSSSIFLVAYHQLYHHSANLTLYRRRSCFPSRRCKSVKFFPRWYHFIGLTSYLTQLVENGNLGSFYKYINKKLNGSNGTASLRDENKDVHTVNNEKADLLKEHFSSVFTSDNHFIDHSHLQLKPWIHFTDQVSIFRL